MSEKIILVSKDALGKFYLPVYGNKRWKTPNIDYLCNNGTIFNKHYTSAPSSAMSYISMFSGLFPYETNQRFYTPIKSKYENTLFDKLNLEGYKTHIIWDEAWTKVAKIYSECYGKNTEFHSIKNFSQSVGVHKQEKNRNLSINFKLAKEVKAIIIDEIKEILERKDEKIFIWLHFPQVINGYNCYGSDIECFDEYIGEIRKLFDEKNIFITADHGNMNGSKNKICYGFDVYNNAIQIPLITPRIEGLKECNFNTSSVDLYNIICNREIPRRKFVYSDSAYYAQPNRKLAIIYKNYKYIYNKKSKIEELYDLEYDPTEECNLIDDMIYDVDRKLMYPLREVYYYENWEEIEVVRKLLREEKSRIWKNENIIEKFIGKTENFLRLIYKRIKRLKKV